MNNLLYNYNKNDSSKNAFSKNKEFNNNINNSESKKISIIDFQNNIDKRISITSPISILALKICGYKQEELYKLTFNEFIKTNPEIKNISKEFQEKRYYFFDKNREEKITKVINIRQKIIDEKSKNNNNNINDLTNYDINKSLNKSNSYSSFNNIFYKSLKNYSMFENKDNRNEIINNQKYNSFISRNYFNDDSIKENNILLSDRTLKLSNYYKTKKENELLKIVENEVNRKLIKKKLLNQELLKLEYDKQRKKKFEDKNNIEQKRLKLIQSAKFKLIKEKEEKALKELEEKEKQIKIRLEQAKEKSKEKEKENQEKNIIKTIRLNLHKIKKKQEYEDNIIKNDEKLKRIKEEDEKKYLDLIKYRNNLEKEREIHFQKTKKLIQERENSILSKSNNIMENRLKKEERTEKILKQIEKERKLNYFLKKSEDKNMKIERDIKKNNILKMKEELMKKDRLKMKHIEERQNQIKYNNIKVKEEKRNNLKFLEIRRNQNMESFEKQMNTKRINILENIKNKEIKYKELCKERDDKIQKKREEINFKNYLIKEKIKNLENIHNFERENIKMEIELKLKKAEDYKNEQNKINEAKKELFKYIKSKSNFDIYEEREKNVLNKEINLETLENMKDLLPGNKKLLDLIIKYKKFSPEDKIINKSA